MERIEKSARFAKISEFVDFLRKKNPTKVINLGQAKEHPIAEEISWEMPLFVASRIVGRVFYNPFEGRIYYEGRVPGASRMNVTTNVESFDPTKKELLLDYSISSRERTDLWKNIPFP